jgi:hypothetical protein
MSYVPTTEIISQATLLHSIIEKWPHKNLAPDEKQILLSPYVADNPDRFLDLSQFLFYDVGSEWMDMNKVEMLSVLESIINRDHV